MMTVLLMMMKFFSSVCICQLLFTQRCSTETWSKEFLPKMFRQREFYQRRLQFTRLTSLFANQSARGSDLRVDNHCGLGLCDYLLTSQRSQLYGGKKSMFLWKIGAAKCCVMQQPCWIFLFFISSLMKFFMCRQSINMVCRAESLGADCSLSLASLLLHVAHLHRS